MFSFKKRNKETDKKDNSSTENTVPAESDENRKKINELSTAGDSQAEQFNQTVGLTGITVTKLDGIAKGGIIFAIANRLGIPIRVIGVGESIDDLRPFDAREFVDALLSRDNSQC